MTPQKTSLLIYKATNTKNGKVYIGATKRSMEERKKDHFQKAQVGSGSYFQHAIATHHPESFIWEEIDTASTIDELAVKEIEYIEMFNSYYNGYNSDKGGGFKKSVYQYDTTGNLIATYSSLSDVEKLLHIDKRRISMACANSTLFGNSFWSYKENDTFNLLYDNRKKTVAQYDLQGNILSRFDSVSEASKLTGISKTCISRCCRGERQSSKGYIWKYI